MATEIMRPAERIGVECDVSQEERILPALV
jgi:hypothetical protein